MVIPRFRHSRPYGGGLSEEEKKAVDVRRCGRGDHEIFIREYIALHISSSLSDLVTNLFLPL